MAILDNQGPSYSKFLVWGRAVKQTHGKSISERYILAFPSWQTDSSRESLKTRKPAISGGTHSCTGTRQQEDAGSKALEKPAKKLPAATQFRLRDFFDLMLSTVQEVRLWILRL